MPHWFDCLCEEEPIKGEREEVGSAYGSQRVDPLMILSTLTLLLGTREFREERERG